MKNALLIVVALVVLGVLGFVAYQKLYKTKMMPTTSALQTELDSTIDDGGKADFDSLTEEASGL